MPQPIVVTAVFTPKEDSFDQLRDALSRSIPEIHEENGCILYAIHSDPGNQIIMIEKWESTEQLDDHAAGEPVKRLDARIAPFLAQPVVVTRLQPIPAGTTHQGQL